MKQPIKQEKKQNYIAKEEFREMIDKTLEEFHGGGNGRRLLFELKDKLKD